jgi:hypothetical protein
LLVCNNIFEPRLLTVSETNEVTEKNEGNKEREMKVHKGYGRRERRR